MNKKAEMLPRNMIVSLLLFVLILVVGISAFSLYLGEQGLNLNQGITSSIEEVNNITHQLGGVVSSVDSNTKTETGLFGSYCDGLLGDNAFCTGLNVIDVAFKIPSITILSFGVIKNIDLPFQVPEIFWITLNSIIIILVVFVIVSSWRKWKS